MILHQSLLLSTIVLNDNHNMHGIYKLVKLYRLCQHAFSKNLCSDKFECMVFTTCENYGLINYINL